MKPRPMSRGVCWALRKDFLDTVRADGEEIVIGLRSRYYGNFAVDRATARLLAKRINQCLDATVRP